MKIFRSSGPSRVKFGFVKFGSKTCNKFADFANVAKDRLLATLTLGRPDFRNFTKSAENYV